MIRYFVLFFALNLSLIAENNYLVKLENPKQINSKTFEFDITIQSTSGEVTISSYQCAFTFNLNLTENDSISLEYIQESSQLANKPTNIIGHNDTDTTNKLIFISGVGSDIITTSELILGKFRITSNIEFNEEALNLKWNFSGIVNTIITNLDFTDITDSKNFINFDNSITDVNNEISIPQNFELSQNYPNPFNPSTKIDFTLPKASDVKIIVFNILGEKVLDVTNRKYNSGKHTVELDGRFLASGTYIYSIEAGKYKSTKKMILLK